MNLENRLIDDLVRIAHAGGGFRLDGTNRLTDDLVRIAHAAGGGGGKIVFSGLSSRLVDDLVRISHAGKGAVFFEN